MVDNFVRRFTVTRVIDGDTVEGTIDFGFHVKQENVRVRLLGINTPETYQKGYEEAKLHLKDLVTRGQVHLHVPNYDKKTFDRLLGMLYVVDRETQRLININQDLLDEGFAVPYMV